MDLRETAAELTEKTLQDFWEAIPAGKVLPLTDGRRCTILSRGNRNRGKGPDFLSAVIRFDDGSELRGDVEIHRKTSMWIAHGHTKDPAYGNVILHAVAENDAAPGNVAFLPCVPILVLPGASRRGAEGIVRASAKGDTFCGRHFSMFSDPDVLRFAAAAGTDRLRKKSDDFLAGMIRQGSETAFFLRLMDLLGPTGGREAFRQLAGRVAAYLENQRAEHFDVLLWGESGLLPDPSSAELDPEAREMVQALWNEWWKLRKDAEVHDGFRFSRPLDSPERKLAYVSRLLKKLGNDPAGRLADVWIKARHPDRFSAVIGALFHVEDPFWEIRSDFTRKPLARRTALAGPDRINLLLTDLALPAIHAELRLRKHEKFLPELERCFAQLPPNPDNGILKKMRSRCFPGRKDIFRSAAAQQGLIHLEHEFCGPLSFQCTRCPFRNSLETED